MPSPATPVPQSIIEEAEKERTQVEIEAREIDTLLKQTGGEVERLQQRQSETAQRLRQVEANLEAYPREEIKDTFAATLDAQMRLFMMRNQVEQLQNKQRALQRYRVQLDRLIQSARHLASVSNLALASDETRGVDQEAINQIIDAQETERQSLARQMHDGPAQSLTNLILQAEIVERLFDSDPAKAHVELVALKTAANTTFQRIRDFIFDLRPMMLDDLGLVPTLKRYAQTFEIKTRLPIQVTTVGERALPKYVEVTIFRSVQELLNDAARHAQVAHAQVTLDLQSNPIVITVEDDGKGAETATRRIPATLTGLDKRIQMLGGRIQMQGGASQGARVRIELPVS
jgi:two-component system sensor histidine kinase DegS